MTAGSPAFRRADNTRIARKGAMGGWDQLRQRLKGEDFGEIGQRPLIYFFNICKDSIRTIPALQHSELNPEDLDCWTGETLVSTPSGSKRIDSLFSGDIVNTPIGPNKILKSYYSGMSERIKITLSNGESLEGTPHHKIYIKNSGLVSLDMLQCGNIIEPENSSWKQKLLSIKVLSTGAIQDEDITIPAEIISREGQRPYIARYGLILMGKFLQSTISTTLTTTLKIMISQTCNVLRQEPTPYTIMSTGLISTKNTNYGHKQKKGKGFLEKISGNVENVPRKGEFRASIVENLLKRDNRQRKHAQKNVVKKTIYLLLQSALSVGKSLNVRETKKSKRKPVHIVAVGYCEDKKKVYNLTVNSAHLFYANGILSSNTEAEDHAADSVRYGVMSRPYVSMAPSEIIKEVTDDFGYEEDIDEQSWKIL